MKKKMQKDCRAPGKMRKWLGHHQEISRAGLIEKRREVRKNSAWRLEPEGETEVPEIIIGQKPPRAGRSRHV